MKRLFAFTFLFALCAGMTPALANDLSCVLESCEKTDISKEAAKAMNQAPGTNIAHTPPQEIIKAIEREIAAEPKSASPKAAGATSRKNPYSQPESCDYFAPSRAAFTRKLIEYNNFLKEEQLRVRAEVIAYGQKLKEDDAAMKVKMAALKADLEEKQRIQAQQHVEYQAQIKAESVAFEIRAAKYTEQLAASQKAMCCPPDEAYTKFLNVGYSTKWNP